MASKAGDGNCGTLQNFWWFYGWFFFGLIIVNDMVNIMVMDGNGESWSWEIGIFFNDLWMAV